MKQVSHKVRPIFKNAAKSHISGCKIMLAGNRLDILPKRRKAKLVIVVS
jgi:hypothetical protein